MLNSATFAFAEEFARVMRNSAKPFGGMQVVTCGDFFQLPPVARDGAVSFAFEADAWNTVFGPQNTIELKQVRLCSAFTWVLPSHLTRKSQTFRQEDPEFISLLNEVQKFPRATSPQQMPAHAWPIDAQVREGRVSSAALKTLTGNIPAPSANDAWFTTLCTHKDDADRINSSRLAQVKHAAAAAQTIARLF